MTVVVASWLLTFLVDSTLLLCAAWLLSRTAFRRTPTYREFAWRAAIVVALVAPAMQITTGRSVSVEPGLQRLAPIWPTPRGTLAQAAVPPPGDVGSRSHGRLLNEGGASPVDTARAETALSPTSPGTEEGPRAPPPSTPGTRLFTLFAIRLWLVVAAMGLVRVLLRHGLFLRSIATRRPVPPGPTLDTFNALRSFHRPLARVRLTGVGMLPAPATLSRREICVPWPRFGELAVERQRALLAHELAHVERHDPFWRWAAHLLVAVFFFQPLLRVARVEMRAASERLADARAVGVTRSPGVVAAALGEVAEWVAPRRSAHALAAVDGSSDLTERVRAILTGPGEVLGRGRPWRVRAMAVAALAATVLMIPAVSPPGGLAQPASEDAPIVDNEGPRLRPGSWRVSGDPRMTCPAAGPGGDVRIDLVVDLVPFGPDRVGILSFSGDVLLLCEGGRITGTLGGSGEGPGRFRSVTSVTHAPGDSVTVIGLRKAVRFDLGTGGFREIPRVDAADDLSLLLKTPEGVAGNRFTDGVVRTEGEGQVEILYVDGSGRELRRIGPVPWTSSLGRITWSAVWEVGPAYAIDEDAYWFASRDGFEIRRYTAHGLERVVRAPSPDIPITEAHRTRALSRMTDDWDWPLEIGRRMLDRDRDRAGGTRAPAVLALLLDDAGRLWAGVPEAEPGRDPRRWRIFEEDGSWVTDVELPPGFHLLAVRNDLLYGVTRAPGWGAETVEVRRLLR